MRRIAVVLGILALAAVLFAAGHRAGRQRDVGLFSTQTEDVIYVAPGEERVLRIVGLAGTWTPTRVATATSTATWTPTRVATPVATATATPTAVNAGLLEWYGGNRLAFSGAGTRYVLVRPRGGVDLVIARVTVEGPFALENGPPLALRGRYWTQLAIRFGPDSPGAYRAEMFFWANDGRLAGVLLVEGVTRP